MSKIRAGQITGIAFRAYRVESYTSGANSNTTNFNFDTELYDYGSCYDTTTGLFTAPVNGVYSFACSFYTEAVNITRAFAVPRGSAFTPGSGTNTGSRGADAYVSATGSVYRIQSVAEFYMTAGQTFGYDVWTGAAGNLASVDTWFAGHLVIAV